MRLLIVDDHPIVLTGCRAIFAERADVEIVDATDGEASVDAYFDLSADLGLIDINLPRVSGFEVLRRILAREPEARLIGFSVNTDPSIAARAIEAGARAYLAKSDPPERYLEALDAIMNGEVYLTPGMARSVAFLYKREPRTLSSRESDVLHGLEAGKTVSEIAIDLGVSVKTISHICAGLKVKLGARSRQDLVRLALERRHFRA